MRCNWALEVRMSVDRTITANADTLGEAVALALLDLWGAP